VSRKKTLTDWGGYAGSQYVARFSMMIRGFIVAKILGPTEYGKWVALLLIYQLGAYVHLGIISGMSREVPFHLGRGEKEESDAYRDCGYTGVLFLTTLFFFVILAIDFFAWDDYTELTRFGLPVMALAVLLENLTFTYHNIFRAEGRIAPVSQSWTIQGISNLALSIPLVIVFGVYGLFSALLLSNVLTLLYLRHRATWRFRLRLQWERTGRLLMKGLPIMAYLFVGVLLTQVDKLVLVRLAERADLGLYGIASTVSGMLRYITTSASFVLFPRFLSKYGRTGDIGSLARNVKEPTFAFSIFIPVFLSLVYVWIQIPIDHVLPKFHDGIEAMRILVCGTVFFSLASLASYFLITVSRTTPLLIGGAIIVVLEYVLNSILVKDYGINGVAFGAAVCQFLYGSILLIAMFRLIPDDDRSVLASLVSTYLPTLFVGAVVGAVLYFLPITETGLGNQIRMGLLRGGIILVATSPLIVLLQKRTGVLGLAFRLVTRRKDEEEKG